MPSFKSAPGWPPSLREIGKDGMGHVLPTDPVKTAGYLIQQAGGVKQAHEAVTAAAAATPRRKGGRPEEANDFFWVCVAADLKRKKKLSSKTAAFRQLADQRFPDHAGPAKEWFVKRLLRKTKGQPLTDFGLPNGIGVTFHKTPPAAR